jgi:hypothetical protein
MVKIQSHLSRQARGAMSRVAKALMRADHLLRNGLSGFLAASPYIHLRFYERNMISHMPGRCRNITPGDWKSICYYFRSQNKGLIWKWKRSGKI